MGAVVWLGAPLRAEPALVGGKAAPLRRVAAGGRAAAARVVVQVQRFVEAEASAVAFSANPVTGDRDKVVIEAVHRAGQALIDGTVTPERTSFDRVARRAASPALTVLSAAQVREVSTRAVTLKALEGHPVDLQCAYKRGVIQLLQCRSVTTLAPA